MRFCGECGSPTVPGARFCGSCGTPTDDGGTEHEHSSLQQPDLDTLLPVVKDPGGLTEVTDAESLPLDSGGEKFDSTAEHPNESAQGASNLADDNGADSTIDPILRTTYRPMSAPESVETSASAAVLGAEPSVDDIICSVCQAANEAGSTFCGDCGSQLVAEPESSAPDSSIVTLSCSECGEQMQDGDRFCDNCGAPAPQHPTECPTCGQPWPRN